MPVYSGSGTAGHLPCARGLQVQLVICCTAWEPGAAWHSRHSPFVLGSSLRPGSVRPFLPQFVTSSPKCGFSVPPEYKRGHQSSRGEVTFPESHSYAIAFFCQSGTPAWLTVMRRVVCGGYHI